MLFYNYSRIFIKKKKLSDGEITEKKLLKSKYNLIGALT